MTQKIESYAVRREIVHGNVHPSVIASEVTRRMNGGFPRPVLDLDREEIEAENAIERWLSPETVDRSLISEALWEMEQHWWGVGLTGCHCGVVWDKDHLQWMRRHKEDVLAQMLGLTIRQEP